MGMVERLAEKWKEWMLSEAFVTSEDADTRWWLNAIADELEGGTITVLTHGAHHAIDVEIDVARHLRKEATQ